MCGRESTSMNEKCEKGQRERERERAQSITFLTGEIARMDEQQTEEDREREREEGQK